MKIRENAYNSFIAYDYAGFLHKKVNIHEYENAYNSLL